MTSKQEIEQLLSQHRSLNTVDEKQVFYEKLTATLDTQTIEERLLGVLELKNSVSKRRIEIEQKIQEKKSPNFRVFPPSEADRAFLEALFFRMNIPFEMTV